MMFIEFFRQENEVFLRCLTEMMKKKTRRGSLSKSTAGRNFRYDIKFNWKILVELISSLCQNLFIEHVNNKKKTHVRDIDKEFLSELSTRNDALRCSRHDYRVWRSYVDKNCQWDADLWQWSIVGGNTLTNFTNDLSTIVNKEKKQCGSTQNRSFSLTYLM